MTHKDFVKASVWTVLVLDLVGLLAVALVRLTIGSRAFSTFCREVSRHTIWGARSALLFLTLMICIVALMEFVLRFFVLKRFGEKHLLPSIVFFLFAYAGMYRFFGWGISLIALMLGGASLVVWWKNRLTWPFVIWHAQWIGLAVFTCVAGAVFVDGEARTQYLWAYKLRNIREGALHYREGWGWLDDSHSHKERFDLLKKELAQCAPGEDKTITIHEPFVTVTRSWKPVARSYRIHLDRPLNEREQWAVCAGISLHFSVESEKAQASVPKWMCSHMSAWQFDDLPSTLATCLKEAPVPHPEPSEIRDRVVLEQKWRQEGDAMVRCRFRDFIVPPGAGPEAESLMRDIEALRSQWSFVGVAPGDFSTEKQ